ncbi:hypothetical protein Tco_1293797 [Tanacetum coccineum]
MATLEFCDTHNMVAYLEKPEGSAEFHQIIDFLTAIHYALTKNPTIYASFVKQFWTTATTSTNVTGEIELTASIDGQAKTIIEASLRRHLKLEDNGGITSLPNTQIFDQLALMGSSTSLLPFIETTPTAEEPALMPHESPLQSVHSLGHDEGSVSLNELMALLIKRVKKLEKQVKTGKARRRTKIVLSEDEAVEEDSSKQGRSLIEELDMDADFSLVPPHDAEIQEKISDDTEVLLEEEDVKKKKDKGKAIVIEDESVQKKSKKQVQEERLGYEEAIRLQEQIDEEEKKKGLQEMAKIAKQLYHALQNRQISIAEVRKNMMVYLKNQGGYKMKDFKGMSYDDIRLIFEKVWDQIHSFVPMDSEEEVQRLKRAVHHVSTKKGQDIFMLVEKDYPLTKGIATLMLSTKLRVDQQSEMADELLTKIYNIANKPRK